MRESGNVAELVANCIQTEPKTHCLFRGFGISSVDSNRMPTRSAVSQQVAKYYPDTAVKRVDVTGVNEKGYVTIDVTLI